MSKDSNDTETNPSAAIPRLLRDGIDTVSARSSDAADLAREKAAKAIDAAKEGLDHAREALGDAYASGRGKATGLYATARERAHTAGETASERLDGNPLGALLGGLALGVALGALLPRTEQEAKLLGGVGNKLNTLARDAIDAAKDAGQAKLADLGLTPDKARESLHTLFDGALAAATSAGTAAVDTARTQGKSAVAS